MIDPTSVELHFADHEGPERATKVFSILVRAGMVLSGLWLGETALSATFGGQIREEFERIDTDEVLAIQGDARQEAVLQEAGIERADVIVAAIDDSNANIQIAITASQLAPEVRVVVRVGDEMYESLARRAGADQVVIPEVVSGERVTDELITSARSVE